MPTRPTSTVFQVMEALVDRLSTRAGLVGVEIDFEPDAQDEQGAETVRFGTVRARQEIEVLSGGQTRTAREEFPRIDVEIDVRGQGSGRETVRRAFEIAAEIEDELATSRNLAGDVVGLQWLVVTDVESELTRWSHGPRYKLTLTLEGRARLR